AIKAGESTGETWDEKKHVCNAQTDAFGDINFGGFWQKKSKYARVAADTSPELLYELLTKQWNIKPPSLVISVTGGAKKFYLKSNLKKIFYRGLIKVAQTTGAWIITGGTHSGVMRHVGLAMRDYALSNTVQRKIVAIGVATWGVIHNKDKLVNEEGFFPAPYVIDTQGQGNLTCLDNNHTHFLLVDDGTNAHYGVEIPLRAELEKYISNMEINGIKTPVVCVVLDGGLGTLRVIYHAICNNTPCVILEGSGRMADVIVHVFEQRENKNNSNNLIQEQMKKFFNKDFKNFTSQEIEECKKKVSEVMMFQSTIRGVHYGGFHMGHSGTCSGCDLHDAMTSALVGNKPDFVSLLLENGVILKDFLKKDNSTLCELYQKLPNCFFLKKLVKRMKLASSSRRQAISREANKEAEEKISLDHVSDEVRHLDLFLWAVVQNNKEMAEIAWDQCGDCISAALAASKILKKMAEESIDADEPQEMLELASHYEDRAIGVFSKCYKNDEERAQKLLVRTSRFWGGTTCLRLALEADDKNFVAESGVQDLLTKIWCGELSVHNPVWRVLVCMVLFPLIYTRFLHFREPNVEPLNCWSRLVGLYCAPQVKFYGNIISYFAFLFLFAVVLMVDFQRTPSAGEQLLCIWLFSLVCEEIRQVRSRVYIKELWNILDILSILLFCLGFGFRLTTKLFYAGKIILCIDFVVFCLRLMAIFTISQTLGPKIIIVKKMMKDIFFFMFLLSIWVVAYGVAKQGILIHNDRRMDWIVRGAIYEPYLIIFGSFPANIDNAGFDINSCSMNGTDPLKPKCPVLNEKQMPVFPEWITIIMLCVYLLFANILLLNLLIAIFDYTFQEVHDNTDKIWKFQRYQLIKEYYSHPPPPPPFVIFSHLYLFIRKMVLWDAPAIETEFSKSLVPKKLNPIEEEKLLSWQALMKDRYLLSVQKEQSQSMEGRIHDTSQK
uniref:Transient receptor potential cation channel, subfamily M, member 2 n=1 Tax=Poecilia latipinna TaxID=48699 RepID=A0A3B3UVA2_9TELE